MLSGTTLRASDMAGTAVFRIVVSSDSIKNATATSHGKSCLLETGGEDGNEEVLMELTGVIGIGWFSYFATNYEICLTWKTSFASTISHIRKRRSSPNGGSF